MNDDLTLSVVIPVYRTPRERLARALDSARALMVNHEVLVVFDGAPEDDLLALVNGRSSEHVRGIVIEHTGLPGEVRNHGIDAAQGYWITFLDADDELIPNGVEQLIDYGRAHDSQVVQGGSEKRMHDSVELCRLSDHNELSNGRQQLNRFLRTVLLPDYGTGTSWAKIYNRGFLVTNSVRFEPIVPMEDTVFMFDAVARSECIGFVPATSYIYHRNDASLVTSFRDDYERRITACLDAFKPRVEAYGNAEITSAFNDYVIFYLLLIMLHYVFNPNNGWSDTERRQHFKSLLAQEPYATALREGSFREFSRTKRISCFALKHHLYLAMKAICAVRNHQLR